LDRSPLRRALTALSWTTIWSGLVWGMAEAADRSMPLATGVLILASLVLDGARASGWAGRIGLGIRVRREGEGWSWPAGPPAQTAAELLALASLAISMRWLVPPLAVPRGGDLPLLPFLGALTAACGLTTVVFALVKGRRRGSVRLTAQQMLIERGRFASAINRSEVDRLRFEASDTRVELLVSVRGRGAIHVLILPAKWTAAAGIRSFATALAEQLQVSVAIGREWDPRPS
jgi:hypothetical protein